MNSGRRLRGLVAVAMALGLSAASITPAQSAAATAPAPHQSSKLSSWDDLASWNTDSGSWHVDDGTLVGSGRIRAVVCQECSRQNPLTEARIVAQVRLPSRAEVTGAEPTIDVAFRNGDGKNAIGVRLSDLGNSPVKAAMFSRVGDKTNTDLGSGSRSTVRSLPLEPGSVQNIELDWRENNLFLRIWPADGERPGAPMSGYTIDPLNIAPNSIELSATDTMASFLGWKASQIVAGYPKEAPPAEDRTAWQTLSGEWAEDPPGTMTSTSTGADAAVRRALCATCDAGVPATAGTVTADFTVPEAAQLADPNWASAGLMLTSSDPNRRVYALGMVGSQSKLTLMNVHGNEARVDETSFVWDAGTTYRIELAWDDQEYEARVWPTDGSRPDDAQVSGNVASFAPEYAGLRQWGVKSATYTAPTAADLTMGTSADVPPWAGPGEQGVYFPTEKDIVDVPTYDTLRAQLPTPIADANPRYVDLYDQTWRTLLRKNILQPSATSPLVRTYVDSGFDPNIMFQWDTLFSLRYAIYANAGFDAIGSLDNWYVLQKPTGEIRRAYDTRSGQVHAWAEGPNGVNPPLFAWIELDNYRQTGDLDRVKKVLPALRAYADWVSVQMWSQASPHQLYWNNGNGNGMDNLPTQLGQRGDGAQNGVGNVDMSSQMVLMRDSLASLEEAVGETGRAADNRAWADALTQQIRDVSWNAEDGRFYEVDAQGKQWKVDSLAGFWTMLAGVATSDQAQRLTAALKDPSYYWGDMVFPTLSRADPRFDPKGDYWKGGVWAPATFSTIKGLEKSGEEAFAAEAAGRYLDGILEVFDYSGTLFELYAPDKQSAKWISNSFTGSKSGDMHPIVQDGTTLDPERMYIAPGTDESGSGSNSHGGSDHIAKDEFVGWTGLAPIALLLEDVIGVEADVPAGVVNWDLRRTDRNGIQNLSLGTAGTLSMIADPRATEESDARICFTGELNRDMTVRVAIGSRSVSFPLAAGSVENCVSTESPSEPTGDAAVKVAHDQLPVGEQQTATGTGFVPGESVQAEMHSDPLEIGVQTADEQGTISFTWTIPPGTDVGEHTVALTGTVTPTVKAAFAVTSPSDGGDESGTSGGNTDSTGNLPITGGGFDIKMVLFGAALIALGLGIVTAARLRRRRNRTER